MESVRGLHHSAVGQLVIVFRFKGVCSANKLLRLKAEIDRIKSGCLISSVENAFNRSNSGLKNLQQVSP